MSSSGIWTRFVSYSTSISHVLIVAFVGYMISSSTTGRPVIDPRIFVFVAISKLFTLVFTENEETSRKTRIYLAICLTLLLPLLIGLTAFEFVVGAAILAFYSVYPLVDGRAPFDVLHHVSRYFLIFILGFGSIAFLNETALLAILAIALFSIAGELAAGLRKNKDGGRSAASLLGVRGSLSVIVFSILAASLMAAFVFNDLFEFPIVINQAFVPVYVVPALAFDLFLMMPLMKILTGKCPDPCQLMRRRELMTLFIVSLSVLVLFQTGRLNPAVEINSRDYGFDVNIRTFIAGANTWDVPWILFDYVNDSNYYYVVFHKDGVLELSQKTEGQIIVYESSIQTKLTPFEYHTFHIVLNETSVVVVLDEEQPVSTTRRFLPDSSGILISHPTGFWITCTYSIKVNS